MILGFADDISEELSDERSSKRKNIVEFAIVHGLPSVGSGAYYWSSGVASNLADEIAERRQHRLNCVITLDLWEYNTK